MCLAGLPLLARAADSPELEAFRKQIEGELSAMKATYEGQIKDLKSRISTLESDNAPLQQPSKSASVGTVTPEIASLKQRVAELELSADKSSTQSAETAQRAATNAGAIKAWGASFGILFMDRAAAPSEDEQAESYAAILGAIGPERLVIIRALAGILLGVGSANFSWLPQSVSLIMAKSGDAIFGNLPLLFAIDVVLREEPRARESALLAAGIEAVVKLPGNTRNLLAGLNADQDAAEFRGQVAMPHAA